MMLTNTFLHERSIPVVSAILFGASSLLLARIIDKERKQSKQEISGDVNDGITSESRTVSSRCRRAMTPATSYMDSFLYGLRYAYDPKDRVDGFVLLCMAENKLAIDLISERLLHPATTVAAFSDPSVYCYNSFLGLPIARQAVSYFLAKRFLHTKQSSTDRRTTDDSKIHVAGAGLSLEQALVSINPNHIGIGSGGSGILNSLFYLLGEDGDACLIPAPYYAAFETDMSVIAGIIPFAVHMNNPIIGPTSEELDLAYIEAKSVSATFIFQLHILHHRLLVLASTIRLLFLVIIYLFVFYKSYLLGIWDF